MNALAVATVGDWRIYFQAMLLLSEGADQTAFHRFCVTAVRKMAWFQFVQSHKRYTSAAHEAAAKQVADHWRNIFSEDNAS